MLMVLIWEAEAAEDMYFNNASLEETATESIRDLV